MGFQATPEQKANSILLGSEANTAATPIGERIDMLKGAAAERAAAAAEAKAVEGVKVENNAGRDDGQQYDAHRKEDSKRPGGEWDWERVAPNNGAVPGTTAPYALQPGDTLDRYGSRYGSFLSPAGTPYEQRALAPGSKSNGYEQYDVLKPVTVERSLIAPAFDQPGGGYQIQYKIPEVPGRPASVKDLIDFEYIKPRKQ